MASKYDKVFTVTWSIEGISYLKYKNVSSANFYPLSKRDERFYLRLNMEIVDDTNLVSFQICNTNDDAEGTHEEDNTEIDFELSILAVDGSPLISRKGTIRSFSEYQNGFLDFVERNEILLNRKDEFLKKDTLMLRCRMWEREMSERVHFVCKTRSNIDRTHLLWTLDGFSSLTLQDERFALIRAASKGDPLLEMRLFFAEVEEEEKIRIEIINYCSVEYCKCKFSILDTNGEAAESFEDELVFDCEADVKKHQLPPFLSKRKLMELKNKCLPNDTLSLKCEFSCYSGSELYISENSFYNLEAIDSTEPPLVSTARC
ncbi:speckle-type POZ protein B [Caerostris extrusa]|uniref:Speckle-type POZ protein B n=1 Tax=Caerostris extrusa TaxID=172846 RepID=A0AAV4USB2_CAEEX|nr:speckle-type POZ protein B [Caerostris extrusa]